MKEEVVCFSEEFRRRRKSGEDYSAGQYFQDNPRVYEDPGLAVDLIFCEIVLREAYGDTRAVEEYLARYPEYADALSQQWEVHLAWGFV